MSKVNIFFLVATLAFCSAYSFDLVHGEDFDDDDDDFFQMHRMPKMEFKHFEFKMPPFPKMPEIKPPNPDEIKKLKPDGPNSHVQGAYQSQSSNVRYVNGKLVENEHKGEVVLNNNGTVNEMKYGNDEPSEPCEE